LTLQFDDEHERRVFFEELCKKLERRVQALKHIIGATNETNCSGEKRRDP
jgi:hypothetical protein